jgi:hypothetical protein
LHPVVVRAPEGLGRRREAAVVPALRPPEHGADAVIEHLDRLY